MVTQQHLANNGMLNLLQSPQSNLMLQAQNPHAAFAMQQSVAMPQTRNVHQPQGLNPAMAQPGMGLHQMVQPHHPAMNAHLSSQQQHYINLLQAQQNPAGVSVATLPSQPNPSTPKSGPNPPQGQSGASKPVNAGPLNISRTSSNTIATTTPPANAATTSTAHPGSHTPSPAPATLNRHTPGLPGTPQPPRQATPVSMPATSLAQTSISSVPASSAPSGLTLNRVAPNVVANVPSAALVSPVIPMAAPSAAPSALVKLNQFSAQCNRLDENATLESWRALIAQYFSDTACLRFHLRGENEHAKPRSYDISANVLHRLYYLTRKCGVQRRNYSFDHINEFAAGSAGYYLDCEKVVLLDVYNNGTKVQHEGSLTVYFNTQFKIDFWDFRASGHTELLPRVFLDAVRNSSHHPLNSNAKKSGVTGKHGSDTPGKAHLSLSLIPESLVNSYGIPEMTVRALEISDVVTNMRSLFSYVSLTNLSPLHIFKTVLSNPTQLQEQLRSLQNAHAAPTHMGLNINANGTSHALQSPQTPLSMVGSAGAPHPVDPTIATPPGSNNGGFPISAPAHLTNGSVAKKNSPKTSKKRQTSSSKSAKQQNSGGVGSTPLASPAMSNSSLMSPVSMTGVIGGSLENSPPGTNMLSSTGPLTTTSMPPPDMTVSKRGAATPTATLMSPSLPLVNSGLPSASPSPVLGKKKSGASGDGTTKPKRQRTTNPSPRGRKPKSAAAAAAAAANANAVVSPMASTKSIVGGVVVTSTVGGSSPATLGMVAGNTNGPTSTTGGSLVVNGTSAERL
ncbi:hypothetical protein IWQ62_002707 [Dispira parvispora]|uniref:LIM-domain binding protein-domain-containing protein n=1 Tax=Dispira parvispora TaxID=1520584 RepID=A0A9W8AW67_9FUNG|nr:hypothetical protein IWQ62_002707 [Dispira parvispora]